MFWFNIYLTFILFLVVLHDIRTFNIKISVKCLGFTSLTLSLFLSCLIKVKSPANKSREIIRNSLFLPLINVNLATR